MKRRQHFPDILVKLYTYQVRLASACGAAFHEGTDAALMLSSFAASRTCMLAGFATETSSRRTCSSTRTLAAWSSL